MTAKAILMAEAHVYGVAYTALIQKGYAPSAAAFSAKEAVINFREISVPKLDQKRPEIGVPINES